MRSLRFTITLIAEEDIHFQVSTIEFSLVEASILHGLKQGNAVLADIHKEMNIESVERLMGETQDAIAYQQVCQYPQELSRD